MKIDLFNINDFIKANHCQEVTSPIFFQYDGNPTPDGLFSYDIFGMSEEDRKGRFGYIDLHGEFLHPLIYSMMVGRMGGIRDVLSGEKCAIIENGRIRYVPETFEGADTGIQFIYRNFEKINWMSELDEQTTDSLDKKTRLQFLASLKKDEFFVNKWLVLPPFYRDQSSSDRSIGDDINKLYKELISKTKSLNTGFSFDIFGDETRARIQNILKDLYFMTLSPVSGKHLMLSKTGGASTLAGSGKNSMFRKHLLGKTIDWTASAVITSPQNNKAANGASKPVPFGETGLPLAHCVSMWQPFFAYYISQTLSDYLMSFRTIKAAQIKRMNTGQFNTEVINKLITKFIKAPADRFEPVKFEYYKTDDKKYEAYILLNEFKSEADAKAGKNGFERFMTLTDLFYFAANDVMKDKHVYVTRYPITSFQSIIPIKAKVMSTSETRKVWIKIGQSNNIFYFGEYPYIKGCPGANSTNTEFYDVMVLGNEYMETLNADYDGDVLYMKPVFSKEANLEAEKFIWSKANIFSPKGTLDRSLSSIGKENIIGLFELTKNDPFEESK